MVKNLPANAGDLGSFHGSEDSSEEETATHFSILAWKIPRMEETGKLQAMELQKGWTQLRTLIV